MNSHSKQKSSVNNSILTNLSSHNIQETFETDQLVESEDDELEEEGTDSEPNDDNSSRSSSESVKSDTTSCSTHSNVFSRRSSVQGRRRSRTPSDLVNSSRFLQPQTRRPPILKIIGINMLRFASKYHKEITIILFLLASALSLVKKGPAKIQTPSSPKPFFSPSLSKYVQDNYNGDYIDLARKTIPFVPTLVFYYAPWDSESLDARNEFLSVAQYFHKTQPGLIKFVAVNCWHMSGQCRQNYKNLSHYPIFVMHVMSSTGVIYGGPVRAHLMIRFIHLSLKPMTRLDNEEQFWNFRSQHDVLMLTYFNFNSPNTSRDYDTYRQVALRSLESDAFGQVGFGIILKPQLAEKYYLSSTKNSISLVLFNEIHTAKWSGGFLEADTKGGTKGPVAQIIDWLSERTKSLPLTWLYPVRNGFANRPISLGSVDLSKELTSQPFFILVTKRYYPSSYSPFFSQVKEVALDYFNCNHSGNVTKLRRTVHKLNAEWIQLWKLIAEMCQNAESLNFNCRMMLPQLNHWNQRKTKLRKDSISNYENVSNALNFTGLSCKTERPIRFLSIDPTDIPHFVQLAFGLHSAETKSCFNATNNGSTGNFNQTCKSQDNTNSDDPIAFFVDAENDIVLPFSKFNISEIAVAIHNFTISIEKRNLNNVLSSHHISEKVIQQRKFNENQPIRRFNSYELTEYLSDANSISNTNSSSLFLMYTAKFCGFCNVMLTQFITLGKFLQNYDLNITLGKIDTFKNSLPSNLTPESLPTFVLFTQPSSKSSRNATSANSLETRVFPSNEEITSKTLLRFLLSELDPKTRVNLSLNATSHQCKESGIDFVHSECLFKNKLSVTRQIQLVLERLATEFDALLNVDNNNTPKTINETETLKLSRPITLWETELLDHLRSVKLTLDIS